MRRQDERVAVCAGGGWARTLALGVLRFWTALMLGVGLLPLSVSVGAWTPEAAEAVEAGDAGDTEDAEDTNEVVEAAIAIEPSSSGASDANQGAREGASEGATDATSSSANAPDDQTEVSTDFGLPADSPLFSGIEEDVEVESSKSSEAADEAAGAAVEGKGADSAGVGAADETASEVTDARTGEVTIVPDDEWLEHGNAVIPLQLPDSSFIYDTSIQELSNADPYLDNQTVQVTGEAIGESIRVSLFGRSRWVTLSPVGESATVSVFMSEESAAKIDSFGRYGVRGSIVRVRGTFYLVCPEHDGATDLHAEEVTVVKPGESVHESFKFQTFVPGLILVVIGLVMVFIFSHVSERRR